MEPQEPAESVDEKAVRLLNQPLQEFRIVRQFSVYDPRLVSWHDTTKASLKRFLLPDSPHLSRFMEASAIATCDSHLVARPLAAQALETLAIVALRQLATSLCHQ
jgi:hypothetical protein